MGFLLGAFGKLAAGRRVRDLQARMMRVQSKLRRTTRQIETMSKMIETQKKAALNNLTLTSQWGGFMGQQTLQSTAIGALGMDVFTQLSNGGFNAAQNLQLNSEQQQAWLSYQNGMTQMKAGNEINVAQMKQQIEEQYENMNEMMLEPLKMEEDSLQTEKDSLESQIQIAQEDYKACKQMEQADAKNLAPAYTGSGG